MPTGDESCRDCLARLEGRLAQARAEFEALAESRGGNDKTRDEVVDLLMHWFIHGRSKQTGLNEHSASAESG